MSTSLMYHAFGVRGYIHTRTEYVGGEVHFTVEQPRSGSRCSGCGSRRVIRRGGRIRRFRGLPIGTRPVWIVLKVARLECKQCAAVLGLPCCGPTQLYEAVRALRGGAGPSHDAGRRGAAPGSELERGERADEGGATTPVPPTPAEGSSSRGHRRDQHRPRAPLLDGGAGSRDWGGGLHRRGGKGAEALDPFWKRLRGAKARIEAVAIDVSNAYIKAVRRNVPEATLVFDHFHVVKLMNDKPSDLRRELRARPSRRRRGCSRARAGCC